jgi:hypothetical protein
MDANEKYFLAAGINMIIPWGRTSEPEPRLSEAGVNYRRTLFYFRTQEFQVADTTTIAKVDYELIPTIE